MIRERYPADTNEGDTPTSDLDITSSYNINTVLGRQVMRIRKNIN